MEEWLKNKLESRLKSGSVCLVALDNDKVIGFNLVAFNKVFIPLIKMKKKLKPHSAWSEQISVHKDYRGRGLGAQLRYRIFAELHKRGIKTFYGGTLIKNIPNLMLTRKVEFEEFVDVHYFKLFNHKRLSYKRIK
jgi:GNAT superfamily N-acetyltransferase